jgi:hypothetical protein
MRTDPNDPNRCIASTQSGQCAHAAIQDHDKCAYHLRNLHIEDAMALKAYLLTNPDIAGPAGRHSQVEELKSLREEIALCRSLVERRLNMIESNADFLNAIGTVNKLFLTLEKLISSCHRLEVNLGTLLSKAALLDLAKEMVEILMSELEHVDGYEALVDRIGERIVAAIANQEQSQEKK